MLNLNCLKDRKKTPPNEKIKKIAKDKYKAYRIHEYTLPSNANVAVWGKVDSIHKKLINIVGSQEHQYPCFLYHGNGSDIYFRLFNRLFFSIMSMTVSCVFLIFLNKIIKLGVIGMIAGLVIIGSLQLLAVRKLFI